MTVCSASGTAPDVLVGAGLVRARRAEGFTFYAVDPDGMGAALDLFSELLDPDGIGPLAVPGGNAACCKEDPTAPR